MNPDEWWNQLHNQQKQMVMDNFITIPIKGTNPEEKEEK